MFEEYDDLLTVDEACEILKIGHNTIYTLLNSNRLKGFRCGRIWKIPKISFVDVSDVLSPKILSFTSSASV